MPTPVLPEIDAALASAAFEKLRPRLDALPESSLAPARTDLRPLFAAAFAAHESAQPLRERLARLPKDEYDAASLDLVKDAALALWHARAELDKALAPPAGLQLPPALVETAGALKERMLRVCKYWLEDDVTVAPMLISLSRKKPGPGEMASDLRRLAALYREHVKVISADVKHFRATDADEAEATANEIGKQLSSVGADSIRAASFTLSRAQAYLLAVHEEVRAAVLWLLRKDPTAAEKFPSLAALPAPRGRPRKAPGAPVSEPPPAAQAAEAEPAGPTAAAAAKTESSAGPA